MRRRAFCVGQAKAGTASLAGLLGPMSPSDPDHGRGKRPFHAGNNGTRLLAHIADRLTAPVPVPVEIPPEERCPSAVTVKYRLIHGKDLPVGLLSRHTGVARQVAAFLTSLHTFDRVSLGELTGVRTASSELARTREATNHILVSSLERQHHRR